MNPRKLYQFGAFVEIYVYVRMKPRTSKFVSIILFKIRVCIFYIRLRISRQISLDFRMSYTISHFKITFSVWKLLSEAICRLTYILVISSKCFQYIYLHHFGFELPTYKLQQNSSI